ncbi:MAG: hypothetical protein U5Q44_14010 [Dehalococcoidia bacterium]|nr:hypothetical protein [Dehalococcoidia bacterium]
MWPREQRRYSYSASATCSSRRRKVQLAPDERLMQREVAAVAGRSDHVPVQRAVPAEVDLEPFARKRFEIGREAGSGIAATGHAAGFDDVLGDRRLEGRRGIDIFAVPLEEGQVRANGFGAAPRRHRSWGRCPRSQGGR